MHLFAPLGKFREVTRIDITFTILFFCVQNDEGKFHFVLFVVVVRLLMVQFFPPTSKNALRMSHLLIFHM